MTVLAALEQSNVKVETSLLVSCVYMLYTLTMPSSFYSEGFHKVDEFTDKVRPSLSNIASEIPIT